MPVNFFADFDKKNPEMPWREELVEFARQLVERWPDLCVDYAYNHETDVVKATVWPRYTREFDTNQIFVLYGYRHVNGPTLSASPPLTPRDHSARGGINAALLAFVRQGHDQLFMVCGRARAAHNAFMDKPVVIEFMNNLPFRKPDDVKVEVMADTWAEALERAVQTRTTLVTIVVPAKFNDVKDFKMVQACGVPFQVRSCNPGSAGGVLVQLQPMTAKSWTHTTHHFGAHLSLGTG